MAKTAVNSKNNRTAQAGKTVADIERYCRGLDQWARSWMGDEKDLQPGEELVRCFRPFLEHLAESDLSRKTIQNHVDNLWLLGGEIIRDLHHTPRLRKTPIPELLTKVIADGGPWLYNADSDAQRRSFESTCRKYARFMAGSAS